MIAGGALYRKELLTQLGNQLFQSLAQHLFKGGMGTHSQQQLFCGHLVGDGLGKLLYNQIKSLIQNENDTIANMSNVAAIIHETFKFWWTGFYRVINNELVLGPFQGPVACTRIGYGKGVCGTSWKEAKTIVVEDVHEFPGHIACSSASKSEIVVPIFKDNQVVGVLDIDSENLATFDNIDKEWLERIIELAQPLIS